MASRAKLAPTTHSSSKVSITHIKEMHMPPIETIHMDVKEVASVARTVPAAQAVYPVEKKIMYSIHPELKHAIEYGGLKKFLNKNLVTIDQLVSFHNEKPWVLLALRSGNFIEAINGNFITINQISRLTRIETESLLYGERGEALKLKIERYLNPKVIERSLPSCMFSPPRVMGGEVENSILRSMLQDCTLLK